jgi:hypothetical protein
MMNTKPKTATKTNDEDEAKEAEEADEEHVVPGA